MNKELVAEAREYFEPKALNTITKIIDGHFDILGKPGTPVPHEDLLNIAIGYGDLIEGPEKTIAHLKNLQEMARALDLIKDRDDLLAKTLESMEFEAFLMKGSHLTKAKIFLPDGSTQDFPELRLVLEDFEPSFNFTDGTLFPCSFDNANVMRGQILAILLAGHQALLDPTSTASNLVASLEARIAEVGLDKIKEVAREVHNLRENWDFDEEPGEDEEETITFQDAKDMIVSAYLMSIGVTPKAFAEEQSQDLKDEDETNDSELTAKQLQELQEMGTHLEKVKELRSSCHCGRCVEHIHEHIEHFDRMFGPNSDWHKEDDCDHHGGPVMVGPRVVPVNWNDDKDDDDGERTPSGPISGGHVTPEELEEFGGNERAAVLARVTKK